MLRSGSIIRGRWLGTLGALAMGSSLTFAGDPVLESPLEIIDTSSPRTTLQGFTESINEIYTTHQKGTWNNTPAARAKSIALRDNLIDCFDLSEVPTYLRHTTGAETAAYLKEVLDRIEIPPLQEIPGADEVQSQNDQQPIPSWTIPRTNITLMRVESGMREGEYLFSPRTVAAAPEMFERVKNLPYREGATPFVFRWFVTTPGHLIAPLVKRLPPWLQGNTLGHHALWQWLALALTLVTGLLVMVNSYRAARKQALRTRENNLVQYCLTIAYPLLAMSVPFVVEWFVAEQIRLSGSMLAGVMFTCNFFILIAGMAVLVSIGSRIAEILIARPEIHPRGLDAQFIRIISRVLSIVAAIILFLEGGKYLGIPLSTLLASAGVGGVAVALAAQDSLKNFFGSIMIILDKPYRIGERIVIKGYDGVVEDIGLRSTKLRLLNGHQVSIPNEDMARSDTENVQRRKHIRRLVDLRIPFETSSEKIAQIVEELRKLLENHPGYNAEFPPRVFFNEFNRDSLNIRIIYWYHPAEYWDFMAFSQKLNLQIKDLFHELKIDFAPPTTITNLLKTDPLDL